MKAAALAFLALLLPMGMMMLLWPARPPVTSEPAKKLPEVEIAVTAPVAAGDLLLDSTQPPDRGLRDGLEDWLLTWQSDIRRNVQLNLELAAQCLSGGRFAQALREFDRVLVRHPEEPLALLGKAMALLALDRAEDTLPLFERALEHQPENVSARFNYGVALMRAGELDSASGAFRSVLERDPAHQRARYNLAVLEQAAERPLHAIDLWRELTNSPDSSLAPPEQADAWFHRGEMAMALYLGDEAVMCFQKFIEMQPDDARAWCNLGIALAAGGRRDDALTALEKALNLDPLLVPAMNQLAFVYTAMFRDTEAESHGELALHWCERSLAAEPNQANVRTLRNTLEQLVAP